MLIRLYCCYVADAIRYLCRYAAVDCAITPCRHAAADMPLLSPMLLRRCCLFDICASLLPLIFLLMHFRAADADADRRRCCFMPPPLLIFDYYRYYAFFSPLSFLAADGCCRLPPLRFDSAIDAILIFSLPLPLCCHDFRLPPITLIAAFFAMPPPLLRAFDYAMPCA